MVQVFVDTAHIVNLAGAAIAYLKWGENAVFHDLQVLSEADITSAIGAVDALSQDAVLVLATPLAVWAAAGDITDAQITALDGKIKATSVAPFDTAYVLDSSTIDANAISVWDACFPDVHYNHPLAIRLLTRSGIQGPVEVKGAAGVVTTNATNTIITETGAFAGLSLVGMYAAFVSNKGWHVLKIISHTNNALTCEKVTGAAVNPGTDWEVVANPDEAFGAQRLEFAMKSINNWGITKKNFDVWSRLLDWPSVDPIQGKPFVLNQRLTPVQDLVYLKELLDFGTRAFNLAYWNSLYSMAWY